MLTVATDVKGNRVLKGKGDRVIAVCYDKEVPDTVLQTMAGSMEALDLCRRAVEMMDGSNLTPAQKKWVMDLTGLMIVVSGREGVNTVLKKGKKDGTPFEPEFVAAINGYQKAVEDAQK